MITLAASSYSFAQTTPFFGIKAGVTSAGIRGDAIGNLDKLLDFTNGWFLPPITRDFLWE